MAIVGVGNKIELVRLDQLINNDQNRKVFISKVYDILPKKKLQIAMPIFEGKIVPLEVGDRYNAVFYTAGGLLQANVSIASRYKSGNLFYMDVELLAEPTKVQRREFYRYNCKIDLKIRKVTEKEYETGVPEDMSVPEESLFETGRILDISGGGLRLIQSKNYDRNQLVKVQFTIPILNEIDTFHLFGRVISSTLLMEGKHDVFEQRMEFLKIRQEDRDKIVRFIFESERMARAKESGR